MKGLCTGFFYPFLPFLDGNNCLPPNSIQTFGPVKQWFMKKLRFTERLFKLATGRNVLFFFGLFVAFQSVILPLLEADIKSFSGGIGVLDLMKFYSPETARTMLASYGPEGIKLYIAAQWTADLVFPLVVGFCFSTMLIWLGEKKWWRLAFLVTVIDWTENIFITILLMQWPHFQVLMAQAACFFTTTKWLFIGLIMVLALFRSGQKLLAWRSQKRATMA